MNPVEIVSFLPYRKTNGEWEVFLQMRDSRAPTNPNKFSTFGGHLEEGEDSLAGLLREIKEELVYVPVNLEYFIQDVSPRNKLFDVYIERVGTDFESKITVMEGEYGLFLPVRGLVEREDVTSISKIAVPVLIDRLEGQ
ncbi:MAG: hypothetical protein JWM46_100 [Candidatus Kaiserbacteria bacterium]|nr:hypothetical protein [Candidatus Kaiserbacteria bacterium]